MNKIRRKKTSSLQRLICAISPNYAKMWTTWNGTIYCPDDVTDPYSRTWESTVAHELVHVGQQKRLGWPLFLFLYLLFPLPVLGAYFRVKFECEAYTVQIAEGELSREGVVDTLWRLYAWPLPPKMIAAILDREIEKISG
jgi:hypothetical protein